jgi:bifunctional NMN adenylyltransferase/nudix hydrolase
MVQIPQQEEVIPDVGIIVGRFQVPFLHDGHREVLDFVSERHHKVIVVLGVPGHGQATKSNPLDYDARVQMIEEEYEHFTFQYIEDSPSDEFWSNWLDRLITAQTSASQTAVLYGSRDSFIPHYTGKFPTLELDTDQIVSGTELRNAVKRKKSGNTKEFREGRVSAVYDQFPANQFTVDIAIFNEDCTQLLLGQKENERDTWRLPGGFAEGTLEFDARKEAREETSLEITDPRYVKSFEIDDWRYRDEIDKKITTALFVCKVLFGKAQGGDDLPRVKWFKVDEINMDEVAENHRLLVEAAVAAKELAK